MVSGGSAAKNVERGTPRHFAIFARESTATEEIPRSIWDRKPTEKPVRSLRAFKVYFCSVRSALIFAPIVKFGSIGCLHYHCTYCEPIISNFSRTVNAAQTGRPRRLGTFARNYNKLSNSMVDK